MTNPMTGKVVLITGATNGIGKETALALAALGATVVGVGRNPDRCAATERHIKTQTNNQTVQFLLADLSSQAQVRQLAATFQEKYPRLDVLINNAGAFFLRRTLTADGIEQTFALNHLAYFLLTHLLLDTLRASAPARIINVASDAHRSATIRFDDLQMTRRYNPQTAYAQSKLANILFTYELARRLAGTGITVNALHPGFVASGFARNNGPLVSAALTLLRPFARSPRKGAETVIYLAASPEVEGVTGQYFKDRRPIRSSPASYDQDTARRLWDISLHLTGLAPQ